MLKIVIPEIETWDEKKLEFVTFKETTLQLEHSLVSVSKWESRWKKPFLSKNSNKTYEELIDYIKCMTLTQNVDPRIYYFIPKEILKKITDYIDDPMTATTFSDKGKGSNEIVTSEILYYLMIALNIPFECQKWHLNRLLALIKVCSIKNTPDKNMSKNEIYSRNRELNKIRRAQLKTKG